MQFLHKLKTFAQKNIYGIQCLGPIPAPMTKKAGKFRGQLLFHSENRSVLHDSLGKIISSIENKNFTTNVRWTLDIDPIDFC